MLRTNQTTQDQGDNITSVIFRSYFTFGSYPSVYGHFKGGKELLYCLLSRCQLKYNHQPP